MKVAGYMDCAVKKATVMKLYPDKLQKTYGIHMGAFWIVQVKQHHLSNG
jgi:hypothetical protein